MKELFRKYLEAQRDWAKKREALLEIGARLELVLEYIQALEKERLRLKKLHSVALHAENMAYLKMDAIASVVEFDTKED